MEKLGKRIKRHRHAVIFSSFAIFLILVSVGSLLYQSESARKRHLRILETANTELISARKEREVLLSKLSEDPLFRVLEDPDPFVRAKAIVALNKKIRGRNLKGQIAEKSFKITLNALNDQNSLVRSNAAILLGLLKDTRAFKPLTKKLSDPNADVRNNIVLALGWLERKDALPHLTVALQDTSAKVRASAVLALGLLKDTDSIKPLLSLINDSSVDVRKNLATVLGEIRDPQGITPLIAMLKDSSKAVSSHASEALSRFGEQSRLPVIISVLSDKKADQESILKAIGGLDPARDTRAVPALINLLKHINPKIRTHAVLTLGLFGQPEAVRPLIQRLEDPDREVRENALLALIGITHQNQGRIRRTGSNG